MLGTGKTLLAQQGQEDIGLKQTHETCMSQILAIFCHVQGTIQEKLL